MERLKAIKEQLISQVQSQMSDLKKVDAQELGAVIDMIKDLAETMYYCSITEAMEQSSEQGEDKKNTYYYMEKYLPYYPDRDYDYYNKGKMYYGDRMYYGNGGNSSSSGGSSGNGGNSSSGNSGTNYYEERYPISFKDEREGRSGTKRKMYMESKQTHQDTSKKIKIPAMKVVTFKAGSDFKAAVKQYAFELRKLLSGSFLMPTKKICSIKI